MSSEIGNSADFYERIRREVRIKNYAEVPISLSRKEFEEAALSFIEFLKLPTEKKDQFYFMVDPENRGTKVGYSRKSKEKGDGDDKEYFHYNEYAEIEFKHILRNADPTVDLFFKSLRNMYGKAKIALDGIMLAFETEFPGIYAKFFPKDRLPSFYLRFLKYDNAGSGNFLARGHYDRGACTLALAESAPGLRIGKTPDTLIDVKHRDEYALFMPALNFSKLTSPLFPPTWHDVVQKSSDTINKEISRWAIVFFSDQVDMESISFEETHTPKY